MNLAYVMISTDMGSEEKVANELKKNEEVKEVYEVYGIYDIVVKIEAETMEKLKATINGSIRTLENVRTTITMIVMD